MASVGQKRSNSSSSSSSAASSHEVPLPRSKKRPKIDFELDFKFVASSQDDLDIGLLRIQNRKLAERLLHRQRMESELRSRIEQLEKKQLNDDTKLYVINRYWNQLNEDMRLILQRFDSTAANDSSNNQSNDEVDDEDENSNDATTTRRPRNENAETTSFVRQLANLDKEELDEQLQQRVLLSTRAVSKVLQAFDRIVQRNEKVMSALKDRALEGDDNIEEQNDDPDTIKSPDHSNEEDDDDDDKRRKSKTKVPKLNLDETVRQMNEELSKENKNLNLLVTSLHEKYHKMSLKYTQLTDRLESKDAHLDDLKNRIDELEFELNKSRTREQRLEDHLMEARERLRDFQNQANNNSENSDKQQNQQQQESGVSSAKVDDLRRELEEQKEIAQSRLAELEQLNNEHKETLKMVERYKIDLQCIPDSVIKDSAEYKSLQSHFSVLFNESMQLKTQLDEVRQQLTSTKNVHLRQIEEMEVEELTMQKRLRNECMALENSLAQARKDYELLRLEFEQTFTANEQANPINRELRHLTSSLQNHTQQLKGENVRLKKKLKETNIEIGRLKQIIEQNGLKVCCGGILLPGHKPTAEQDNMAAAVCTSDCHHQQQQQQHQTVTKMSTDQSDSSNDASAGGKTETTEPVKNESSNETNVKKESPDDPLQSDSNSIFSDDSSVVQQAISTTLSTPNKDFIPRPTAQPQQPQSASLHRKSMDDNRELKAQLKKSYEAQRELKILLDMFKTSDKEKRDKVQLMAAEKKLKIELEELRQQNKKLMEEKRSGGMADHSKKMTRYEEIIRELQKNVTTHKQQEEALSNEMEITGQAFEDMQDQNCRLLQQLREKDDANFKLMSERIKSNQMQKLMKEEKDMLTEQILTLQQQIETQNQVVRKLEEKERMLQNTLTTTEKELSLRQQAMDFLKRKALESSQSAADLKLHLDKYVAQIKDAQSIVADKTSAWQQEAFKTKRLHEEVLMYKRKYERAKKFELAATADEVLQEEIRELREELTCPSCKTKRKDAVLNKCFHVFCYDCLKTRYETRQRKCPKCNQSFSANDFHRLYLA